MTVYYIHVSRFINSILRLNSNFVIWSEIKMSEMCRDNVFDMNYCYGKKNILNKFNSRTELFKNILILNYKLNM